MLAIGSAHAAAGGNNGALREESFPAIELGAVARPIDGLSRPRSPGCSDFRLLDMRIQGLNDPPGWPVRQAKAGATSARSTTQYRRIAASLGSEGCPLSIMGGPAQSD